MADRTPITKIEAIKMLRTDKNSGKLGIVYLNIGLFFIILGLVMYIPAIVDAAQDNPDWQVFAICASLSIVVGGLLFLANQARYTSLTIKQGFLITASTWLAVPLMGAIPFVFSGLNLSYTDAVFEAMSGVTTTGSTVITGLDGLPPGILLWRSLLQWLGGVGIIAMGVAIMPLLQIGGMQLFRVEAFDVRENFIPRSTKLALSLSLLYAGLTLICAVVLWLAGMNAFEAACHAFTTLSTGGFSTSDASVGHFDSALIEFIISFFMVVGSLPFILYLRMLSGKSVRLFTDVQVKGFLILLMIIIIPLSIWLYMSSDHGLFNSIRYTTFNVISVITGTGYASTDYTAWGNLSILVFFIIMFIGGCSGSTSCGIKIFRFQIVLRTLVSHLKKYMFPNGVFIPRYSGQTIPENVTSSVYAFMFLFAGSLAFLTLALTMVGIDFQTAISGAGTALSNVGPGVGDIIGPAGNFKTLPDSAKWILTFAMLLGRLEIFSILVLFSPVFWRQ
ncbi:MAG TPA: TrkH family potassium uptake protein [Emcibacteraceae bacterium]|nr:TrkH family potassium uptake protein [Emcibacteraceae bacterium]